MPTNPRETPIERIFREVMGRKMPLSIKGILLRRSSPSLGDASNAKNKTPRTSHPNVLDYPGTISLWEKESLAAGDRLSSKTTQQVRTLAAVSPEMAKPRVAASAKRGMDTGSKRELVLVHGGRFRGYACSSCAWKILNGIVRWAGLFSFHCLPWVGREWYSSLRKIEMPAVFTIGHSTRTWKEFLEILRAHCVERVIDVRSIPSSRHNPQFDRETLRTKLRAARIGYVHLRKLGSALSRRWTL
jgi:hypothetical protein